MTHAPVPPLETVDELYEQAPCGYLTLSMDGAILRTNQTFKSWLQLKDADLDGRRIHDLLSPATRIFYETQLAPRLQIHGLLNEVAIDMLRADGVALPLLLNANRKNDAQGRPFLTRVTVFNATQRRLYERELLQSRREAEQTTEDLKRLNQALQASEMRRKLALESAELGAWHVDPKTRELHVDERFRTMFFMDASSIGYQGAMERLHPDDHPRVRAAIRASLNSLEPKPYEVEYRVLVPEGGIRWILAKGRANFEGGTLTSFDGTAADITQRKMVEESMARSAAELAEANRIKSEFLAVLAHELRNPLAPIRNGIELIKLVAPGNDQLQSIQQMMARQMHTLERLIEDLNDAGRVSSGKLELRLEITDIRPILERALDASRPLINRQEHELSVHIMSGDLGVNADPIRMAQAVSNLLNNAAKYTPARGRIWLKAERIESEVVISVTDSGVGLSAAALSTIFTMFAQISQHRDLRQGGLGIGLSLSKRLVELHGGCLSASSPGPELGSTFTLRLPAWIPEA